MVDLTAYAFAPCSIRQQPYSTTTNNNAVEESKKKTTTNNVILIPSQVTTRLQLSSKNGIPDQRKINSKNISSLKKKERKTSRDIIIPSQVKQQQQQPNRASFPTNTTTTTTEERNDYKKQQRNANRNNRNANIIPHEKKLKKRKKKQLPTSGNYPDVMWRCIPMDHLRQHPRFEPLPEKVTVLSTKEDVSSFRQESWQWEVLHQGRCTTSQSTAALGFLEPRAAEMLGIPPSLRRNGGQGAYHRLREPPAARTLEEFRTLLLTEEDDDYYCEDDVPSEIMEDTVSKKQEQQRPIWTVPLKSRRNNNYNNNNFAAQYNVPMTLAERNHRRNRVVSSSYQQQYTTRMEWGNAQEATSVLTALNYIWKHEDSNIVVKEIGMCGAGLSRNATADSLLVGASPDALLQYSNGTLEVLEVKNHCPFYPPRPIHNRGGLREKDPNFVLRNFPFREPYLPPMYISQLQMEMYCSGSKSAMMVRQTALNGALILRLQRDDEWIEEMLHWLERFYDNFVVQEEPPPPNFFFDQERYQDFLQHTLRLADTVQVVQRVDHWDIQRRGGPREWNSLFLD